MNSIAVDDEFRIAATETQSRSQTDQTLSDNFNAGLATLTTTANAKNAAQDSYIDTQNAAQDTIISQHTTNLAVARMLTDSILRIQLQRRSCVYLIETNITTQKTTVSGLQTSTAARQTTINSMIVTAANLTTVQARVDNLESNLASLQGNVSALSVASNLVRACELCLTRAVDVFGAQH